MPTTTPRPNRNSLNQALDIYRDEMRVFIASHLEIDAASIDINDFPRLVERHWGNTFQQHFKKDRYVSDKIWSDVEDEHIQQIWDACRAYFSNNPYRRWFDPLNDLIAPAGYSYYAPLRNACHLDLVPYATYDTWSRLSYEQQTRLRQAASDTLGYLLRDSSVRILVLNGRSVIQEFQSTTDSRLTESYLPNSSARAYAGTITTLSDVPIERNVHVLGFSAYIQRASNRDVAAIKQWLTRSIAELGIA